MASLHTRDCILLVSANVDLWSNSMDWHGSNFYDPHTSIDQMQCRLRAWEGHYSAAGLATQTLPHRCRGRLVVGLTGRMLTVEWAKYRWNNAGVGWLHICIFQKMVPEIIIAISIVCVFSLYRRAMCVCWDVCYGTILYDLWAMQ